MFSGIHRNTHASSRLGEHGSQDRLCKTRILRSHELMKMRVGYYEQVMATISLDFLSFPRHISLPHTCNVSIFRELSLSNYKCGVYRLDIIILPEK